MYADNATSVVYFVYKKYRMAVKFLKTSLMIYKNDFCSLEMNIVYRFLTTRYNRSISMLQTINKFGDALSTEVDFINTLMTRQS